ncbi:uncharacterized protein LOC141628854 [Silene latifolia]|uniref:uncharacterized protein LOC141628854 n=1 Tax=Silene latifolia TaxID=37657 RepID=UPI003D771227
MQGIWDVHHDVLVLTMQIGTARVLRILVDGGSVVNLIMLDILKDMKIDENQIINKLNVLVGFGGETKNTLGKIYLPTYNAILEAQMETDKVILDPKYPDRHVLVGSDVPDNIRPKLKRIKFVPERNTIINEEVDKLLDMGMIREVVYPDWLANVVVVQKKNGKWRVCVHYTDLNKGCPKDLFRLPHIDAMVDATAGDELLTFMDASSGFN